MVRSRKLKRTMNKPKMSRIEMNLLKKRVLRLMRRKMKRLRNRKIVKLKMRSLRNKRTRK